ncbi:MAG: prepilin-type N-terminal cleavage/methylation domain-containing protein [Phycisphaera sp.]|nr:prepilin-type N-terminal cleavage/methylation domain-containing protein [Phycisphaera sp.]
MTATQSLRTRRAFTIVELLVVMAIIVLLVAMVLPSLQKAKVSAKRAREASDNRGTVTAILYYASDYARELPRGTDSTGGNWTWTLVKPWKALRDDYGMLLDADRFGCSSWTEDNPGNDWWFTPSSQHWRVPWVYWGNRAKATGGNYVTMERLSTSSQATSDTLITCFCRETSFSYASYVPHVREYADEGVSFPAGKQNPWEQPETYCVGYVDGSVLWLDWNDLGQFHSAGGSSNFYYGKRRH